MQFVINNTKINDDAIPPDLTLLRYLREHKKLCGTKEGCASGDCGACTVMLGSLVHTDGGDVIEYKTVNSCIAPAAVSAGKHIVTIEHLNQHQQLHPAQAAMVDCHGSQCGFCTPGFVVSLACMHEQNTLSYDASSPTEQAATNHIEREDVSEAISGNLCRCTGYRPIIDAGTQLNNYEPGAPLYTSETLGFLQDAEKNTTTNASPMYFYPTSTSELNTLIKEYPSAKLIAGGTDLVLEITQHYKTFTSLIDVSRVSELTTCHINTHGDDASITIGAAVSYSSLESLLHNEFPEFTQLLKRFASRQIRNRGTIGGNIANGSPIADMPPILLALDAELHIGSADGNTRTCALNDFYLGYKQTDLKDSEYIISVQFPKKHIQQFVRFYKVSKRIEDDISSVMLAVRLDIQDSKIIDARIAYGGMAATPLRVRDAELALVGASVDNTNDHTPNEGHLLTAVKCIQEQLNPMTDVRASAEYRCQIAGNLLMKSWYEAQGESLPNLGNLENDSIEGEHHA